MAKASFNFAAHLSEYKAPGLLFLCTHFGVFLFCFFPSVSILLNHLFSSFFSSNCTIQFVSEIVSLSNSLGANFEQSKLLLKTKVANADKLLCPFHINSCYKDCRSMTCDSSFLVPIFFSNYSPNIFYNYSETSILVHFLLQDNHYIKTYVFYNQIQITQ